MGKKEEHLEKTQNFKKIIVKRNSEKLSSSGTKESKK